MNKGPWTSIVMENPTLDLKQGGNIMGPLSFSLPPSHSCVLRGHPQLKVVGIIRTESMRATLPGKKREMQAD